MRGYVLDGGDRPLGLRGERIEGASGRIERLDTLDGVLSGEPRCAAKKRDARRARANAILHRSHFCMLPAGQCG